MNGLRKLERHGNRRVVQSRCPACGSKSGVELERHLLRDQHLRYAGNDALGADRLDDAHGTNLQTYRVIMCTACQLQFADPAVAPSEHWYSELYGQLQLYPSSRWEFGVVADALKMSDVVVDYGCGDGEFLMSVRGQVAHAFGFDFSAAAVHTAIGKGLDARKLDLGCENLGDPLPKKADHVVAFQVLEHLARPEALFQFAKSVCGPAASLWVAVPSDRRASRVYGEPDALDSPPHHLSRWTASALKSIGAAHGWTMERHVYEPLSTSMAVWEAARRHPWFDRTSSRWRPVQRLARRGLAAGIWLGRHHQRAHASGFSMLARYRHSENV